MRSFRRAASDLAARVRLAEVADADGRPFLGCSVDQAWELARRRGARLRVVDDAVLGWTLDHQARRVTVIVERGTVIRAERG